jgi:hypothetical protein
MSNCRTCDHPGSAHTPLAGCLAQTSATSYCTCTAFVSTEAATPAPQPPRQDLQEGRQRRDEGMEAAGSTVPGAIASAWRTAAQDALKRLVATGRAFSADDLVEIAGEPPRPNMLGPLFAQAARRDEIVAVGYTQGKRPSAHARVQRTWLGA